MPVFTEGFTIQHRGLRYVLPEGSFLTPAEAEYALERVWELCDGKSDWDGPPLVEFVAASTGRVDDLFFPSTPPCPALSVAQLLPPNTCQNWTFHELPGWLLTGEGREWAIDQPFPIDLVALTFLMLTRWEEYTGKTGLDQHGRAVRQDLLATRYQCEDRPIVDQWALVLRAWIGARAEGALQTPPPAQIRMTHDVDRPLKFTHWSRVARGAMGELVARSHNPLRAAGELVQGTRALWDYRRDPFYLELKHWLDWNEQQGLRGCFYWMTAEPGPLDDGYDARTTPNREIVAEVVRRGHEIGWHPGYQTNVDPLVFQAEKQRLDEIRAAHSCSDQELGGRQHYLRWTAGHTWENWEDAGLTYDSSVGYADRVGFRCGTARPYPVYSLARRRPLRLIERPLALMDVALEIQCQADRSDPHEIAERLLRQVQEVHGEAVLLIHNSFINRRILAAMTGAVERHAAERKAPIASSPAATPS